MVNISDRWGRTCLDWAAVGGQSSSVTRIVGAGGMLGNGINDGRNGLDYVSATGECFRAFVCCLFSLTTKKVTLLSCQSWFRCSVHWKELIR